MPKRQRQKSPSGAKAAAGKSKQSTRNESRESSSPMPVPDPPASLIKLLQKDKKVLQYFASLQENLNLDVQRWKSRALDYKTKYKELQQQQINEPRKCGDLKKNENDGKGSKSDNGGNGIGETEDENTKVVKRRSKKAPKKTTVPVRSIVVSGNQSDQQLFVQKSSSELGKNDANVKKYDEEESSLSDDSLFDGGPAYEGLSNSCGGAGTCASIGQKDDNGGISPTIKVKNRDGQHEISLEKGEPLTDKDFLAELPSGGSSNESDHSSSSSSGSFGDVEAELCLDYENNNSTVDDNKDRKIDQKNGSTGSEEVDYIPLISQDEDERKEVRKNVLNLLMIAFDDFKMIGVHLVDVQRPQQVTIGDDEKENKASDNNDIDKTDAESTTGSIQKTEDIMDFEDFVNSSDDSKSDGFLATRTLTTNDIDGNLQVATPSSPKIIFQANVRPIITRRPDNDVIQDIMRSIRSLIRKPTLCVESSDHVKINFQPFLSKRLIPACYPVDRCFDNEENVPAHPLQRGLMSVERALSVMDTYTSKQCVFSNRDEWERLLAASGKYMDAENDDDWEKLESIRIGFMNRDLSSTILSSLEGEITNHWASIDRTGRFDIKSPIDPTQCDDNADDLEYIDREEDAENFVKSFNTNNRAKLFALLERVCLASMVSTLYQNRGDIQAAAEVVLAYIISAAPSPQIEDYPKYAPVLSFCILESMLRLKSPLDNAEPVQGMSWFSHFLSFLSDDKNVKDESTRQGLRIQNLLNTVIDNAIKIWRQRNRSDEKVKGVSAAEIAAYKRLCITENAWLQRSANTSNSELGTQLDSVCESLRSYSIEDTKRISLCHVVHTCLSSQLTLFLVGDVDLTMHYIEQVVEMLKAATENSLSPEHYNFISHFTTSCVATCVQLQQLKWEAQCLSDLRMEVVRKHTNDDIRLGKVIQELMQNFDDNLQTTKDDLAKLIIRCCILSSDGGRAYQLARTVCRRGSYPSSGIKKALNLISGFPLVRVINLKCREDRWKQFITYARRFQLLAVLSLTHTLDETTETASHDAPFWNAHAYNGKDIGHLAFEQHAASTLPKNKKIGNYLTTHWRPSDLRTFDVNACRGGDGLVRTSVSEKACALSHISSWISVKKSILDDGYLSEEDQLLQLYRISGFASGPAFLLENEGIPPSPVCVIFEDDATIVDQFNDKLRALLKELPRDFHFCSIGYSRPKNAPMIQYSDNIGIPTCFWYLTGYILSLEGAKFLLDSLPVRGPVDSWIGTKALANWENEYGRRMGVGSAPKAKILASELPNRKQLGDIVKFRAFAALTPLCSQKIAWKSSASMSRDTAKWRERDTDVTYSGHQ